MMLFIKYLRSDKILNLDEMMKKFNSKFYKISFMVTGVAFVLKFLVCLLGHPFILVRQHYYPYPEAFSLAYSWIIFYFIEILVFTPTAYILNKKYC